MFWLCINHFIWKILAPLGIPGGTRGKELEISRDIRDSSLIPGSGKSPGRGHGNPLQYSCLENPLDRGAWWSVVHGVTQSQTRLKGLSMHAFLILIFFCFLSSITHGTLTPYWSFITWETIPEYFSSQICPVSSAWIRQISCPPINYLIWRKNLKGIYLFRCSQLLFP